MNKERKKSGIGDNHSKYSETLRASSPIAECDTTSCVPNQSAQIVPGATLELSRVIRTLRTLSS